MIFQSYAYVIFFIIVGYIYSVCYKKECLWKKILLCANIFFYSYKGFQFLWLLLIMVLGSYLLAVLYKKYQKSFIINIAIVVSVFPLILYKYYAFLYEQLLSILSIDNNVSFDLGIPLGISFYTFTILGYLFDVKSGKIEAELNLLDYALFVSFFPQIISGPIARTKDLLGQIKRVKSPEYDNASLALLMMGIGFFYKTFIADTIGIIVDAVYNNSDLGSISGLYCCIVIVLYAFQIYADFNGYTLIARGSAKFFGLELNKNFNHPYLAISDGEFWHRWHISLSSWLRDYVYIPLGGSRNKRKCRTYFNIIFTFLVSGIWHGANWTFILWGALHGMVQCVAKIVKWDNWKLTKSIKIITNFIIVALLWVFFRAATIHDALEIIENAVFNTIPEVYGLIKSGSSLKAILPISGTFLLNMALSVAGIILIILIDIFEEKTGKEIGIHVKSIRFTPVRWIIYILILIIPLALGQWGNSSQFIYFQF